MPTPQEAMYDEAVSAARSGDRARARDLLTRLLKTTQENADYWVWMSAVVETSKERAFCLKEALRVDPGCAAAERGLALLGVTPADMQYALAGKLQQRGWAGKVELPEGETVAPRQRISPAQMAALSLVLLAVLGLIAYGLFGMRDTLRRRSTRPIIIIPTTETPLASANQAAPTATVEEKVTPQMLADLLDADYTPTPLHVNTPHSVSEAYTIGIRAYQRGEWDKAREFLEQALQLEPGAVDVLYYLAEIERQQGSPTKAVERYNEALQKDPGFAPLYLGRARARMAQAPRSYAEVIQDLRLAVEKDPMLGEAYLALSDVHVREGKPELAVDLLQEAARRMPDSPLVYLTRAEANLALGNIDLALSDARQASSMDRTLLPAYRIIGEALQARGAMRESLEPLNTYVRYSPDDAEAWSWIAAAQLASGDRKAALKSLDQALKGSKTQVSALLLHGDLLLESGQAEQALADYKAVSRVEPGSFPAAMGQARALMDLKYPGDAYTQIERSKILAQSDTQKAEWQYWRARSLDALGETAIALRDYRAVIALPAGAAREEWVQYAQKRAAALEEKTATLVPSPSAATAAPQPARTATPMQTPSPAALDVP